MASKQSKALLVQSHRNPRNLEKTISLESCDDDDESTCDHITYGDAMFTCFIVAPLVVSVWRGTWGIMEQHPELFPFAQIFIIGNIIHACFAMLSLQLLNRSIEANQPPSTMSWLQERILSRIYTYVFIISNIMHWRGGWGLFDAAVAAIIPDGTSPYRPALIAAFITIIYACSITLRSSRNLLASPYFLVTDGKKPTYIFTTRFQKQYSNWILSPPVTPTDFHQMGGVFENQNVQNTGDNGESSPNRENKMLTSSLKTSVRGTKLIRIEIYNANQFATAEESSCKCNAEICAQRVVSNVYSDQIYVRVREILKSMDNSMYINL